MKKKWQLLRDAIGNWLIPRTDITYISDRSNWAVSSIALDVTKALQQQHLTTARVTTTHIGARKTLLHFGSPYTYLFRNGVHKTHASNQLVISVFHVPPNDERLKKLGGVAHKIKKIHTPTSLTRDQLSAYGFPAEKIVCIPLGIDLDIYSPVPENQRQLLRHQWGIKDDQFVIGSFQKDGHGWGDGAEPKLVKGPDLLVEAARIIAKTAPVFILLAGPARGYVKKKLEEYHIPYHDLGYQNSRLTIAAAYHALDAYLISSRVEGGPLQLLEAWASGIPVISTRVGMVADLGRPDQNIAHTDMNADDIAHATLTLWQNRALQKKLSENGLHSAAEQSWPLVARRYYDSLYQA